jgi:hypothetical protein
MKLEKCQRTSFFYGLICRPNQNTKMPIGPNTTKMKKLR